MRLLTLPDAPNPATDRLCKPVVGYPRGIYLTHGLTQPSSAHRSRQQTRLKPEADARTRTGDPFITSEVLYQLSYVGGAPPWGRP